MAKKVPEEERIAVAKEIRELLSTQRGIEGNPESFRRVWTQASLGKACGVSQETLRRAMEPAGVTAAVRNGLLALRKCSIEELLGKHQVYLDHLRSIDPKHQAMLKRATEDSAVEILIRNNNRPLRAAERAVSAAVYYTLGEEEEQQTAERWAHIAEWILKGDEAAQRANQPPPRFVIIGKKMYVVGSKEAEEALQAALKETLDAKQRAG